MYEEFVPEWNDPIPDSPPASFNHDQFAGWFHLPALKHLEIWLWDTARLKERPQDLNNLQTLVLARSTIPEEDVPFILNRTTSLQNLHLGLAYSYYCGYVFEKSDCIVRALDSVSNTVERLSVGLDHYPVVFNERDFNGTEVTRYEHVQEALKKFTCLKTVELPICLSVSYDVYPDNDVDLSTIWPDTLCEVGLRIDMKAGHENEWDELRMVDWVYDVLLKQRDAVPHLQWIIIRFWEPFYDDLWQEDEKRLQAKCEEIGIPLEFVNDDLSWGLWTRTIP
ncbi:uncharacterized protein ACHE_40508S [Aspergillus chevalieri]|uniref:Uncharacterized protein n=1 Tax=Aspergillus chevalieri TaxID=182096 RepID=A0A7R7VNP6_ASPCH|nr:uncharacterized protein ACHE_40508S [Aspergillus chevalieri]BCR87944.1 hypothetical protein ACHE_40508S [Aspergillus chevalieri]